MTFGPRLKAILLPGELLKNSLTGISLAQGKVCKLWNFLRKLILNIAIKLYIHVIDMNRECADFHSLNCLVH